MALQLHCFYGITFFPLCIMHKWPQGHGRVSCQGSDYEPFHSRPMALFSVERHSWPRSSHGHHFGYFQRRLRECYCWQVCYNCTNNLFSLLGTMKYWHKCISVEIQAREVHCDQWSEGWKNKHFLPITSNGRDDLSHDATKRTFWNQG